MSRVVFYLMSGAAHLHYLVPSLFTLRKHWSGPVQVWAYPESFPFVERIATDKRLGITAHPWYPTYMEKNGQSLNKIKVAQAMDCKSCLYIDADTTIHGNLDELFDAAESHQLAITQFNDWTTKKRTIQNRVGRLRDFPGIDQFAINHILEHEYPSINSGIFATIPKAEALPVWYDWTWESRKVFISDEATLHAIPARFSNVQVTTLLGGKYNCSHMFQPDYLKDEDVAIYHYHGDGNVRPQKNPRGVQLWTPIYRECFEKGYGYIDKWHNDVKNGWFDKIKGDVIHGNLV